MTENRKHLASVRVVQRNLVFVVGLSQRLADAEVIRFVDVVFCFYLKLFCDIDVKIELVLIMKSFNTALLFSWFILKYIEKSPSMNIGDV